MGETEYDSGRTSLAKVVERLVVLDRLRRLQPSSEVAVAVFHLNVEVEGLAGEDTKHYNKGESEGKERMSIVDTLVGISRFALGVLNAKRLVSPQALRSFRTRSNNQNEKKERSSSNSGWSSSKYQSSQCFGGSTWLPNGVSWGVPVSSGTSITSVQEV